jgi:DNA-binding CsgD family transcriptional regulator
MMSEQRMMASATNMAGEKIGKLSDQEQDRLVSAIEAAIDVHQQDQFHAWILGPFHALLPYDSVVCMEINDHGEVRHVECLQHALAEAMTTEFLCNPVSGIAVQLARHFLGNVEVCGAVDATMLAALLDTRGFTSINSARPLHNAVVYRTKFISGVGYCLVLLNVPDSLLGRCKRLFKLLSAHLKMALARAIAAKEREQLAPLSQRELEILRWMGDGKSNREISTLLGISAITLRSYVNKLYRKLDVQTRAEAVNRGLSARVHGDKQS